MAEWYFEMMGQPVGPITGKQLLERVRSGDIVVDTPVRKDDSQWVPARDVGGLFTAAGGGQERDSEPFYSKKCLKSSRLTN